MASPNYCCCWGSELLVTAGDPGRNAPEHAATIIRGKSIALPGLCQGRWPSKRAIVALIGSSISSWQRAPTLAYVALLVTGMK